NVLHSGRAKTPHLRQLGGSPVRSQRSMTARPRRPSTSGATLAAPASVSAAKSRRAITAPPEQLHQNSQIPITSHLCPAGSCLGGFRTPAHAYTCNLRWPASENLHLVGHWRANEVSLKADVWPPHSAAEFQLLCGGRRGCVA